MAGRGTRDEGRGSMTADERFGALRVQWKEGSECTVQSHGGAVGCLNELSQVSLDTLRESRPLVGGVQDVTAVTLHKVFGRAAINGSRVEGRSYPRYRCHVFGLRILTVPYNSRFFILECALTLPHSLPF